MQNWSGVGSRPPSQAYDRPRRVHLLFAVNVLICHSFSVAPCYTQNEHDRSEWLDSGPISLNTMIIWSIWRSLNVSNVLVVKDTETEYMISLSG